MRPGQWSAPRWGRRAVALIPAFVIATFIANGSVPVTIRLEALMVLITTLVRPAIGLMLVALLAPMGDAIVPLLGAAPARHAETLVVAFLAGWLSVRADEDEPRPTVPANLANAMWVFGGVLVASVAATALQLQRESPAALQGTLAGLTHGYLAAGDGAVAHTAGQLLEGLGLICATALLSRNPRDRFWLRVSIVSAGVVGSIASGLLVIDIAPIRTLARQATVGIPRYSATGGDVNAAASWHLLLVGVSVGMATSARRTRAAWLVAAVILLAGLALTKSGAGVIGAVVLFAAAMLGTASAVSRPRKIVGTLVVVALIAGAIAYTRTARAANSIEMRGGFTQASLRFIEARPAFGIGAGRYYPLSRLVLPPQLSWLYGRENAHDYYAQVTAELGLVGVAAFAWIIGAALRGPTTRVWKGRAEGVTAGCVGGVLAYLVTALTGHPFLVPETVFPFWMVLGLLVTPQAGPVVRSTWRHWSAIGFACLLLLTTPLRGDMPRVRLPAGDDGFGPWRTDEGGRPFREAGPFASLFVGPTITAVEIPMRLGGDRQSRSAIVGVSVLGAPKTDVRVGGDWTMLVVPLPAGDVIAPFQRIDLGVRLAEDSAPTRGPLVADVGQIRLVTTQ